MSLSSTTSPFARKTPSLPPPYPSPALIPHPLSNPRLIKLLNTNSRNANVHHKLLLYANNSRVFCGNVAGATSSHRPARSISQLAESLLFEGYYHCLILFPSSDSPVPSENLLLRHRFRDWTTKDLVSFWDEYSAVYINDTAEPSPDQTQQEPLLTHEEDDSAQFDNSTTPLSHPSSYPFPEGSTAAPPTHESNAWTDCLTYQQYLKLRLSSDYSIIGKRYSVILLHLGYLLEKSVDMELLIYSIRQDLRTQEDGASLLHQARIIFFYDELDGMATQQTKWIRALNSYFNNAISLYKLCAPIPSATPEIIHLEARNTTLVGKSDVPQSCFSFQYSCVDTHNYTLLHKIIRRLIVAIIKIHIQQPPNTLSHIVVPLPFNDVRLMEQIEQETNENLAQSFKKESLGTPLRFVFFTEQNGADLKRINRDQTAFRLCILLSEKMENFVPQMKHIGSVIDCGFCSCVHHLAKFHCHTEYLSYISQERALFRATRFSSVLRQSNVAHVDDMGNRRTLETTTFRLYPPHLYKLKFRPEEYPVSMSGVDLSHMILGKFLLSMDAHAQFDASEFPFLSLYQEDAEFFLHSAVEKLYSLDCIQGIESSPRNHIFEQPTTCMSPLGTLIYQTQLPIELAKMLILSSVYSCTDAVCLLVSILLTLCEHSLFTKHDKKISDIESRLVFAQSDHFTLLMLVMEYEKQSKRTSKSIEEWCGKRDLNLYFLQSCLDRREYLFSVLDHLQVERANPASGHAHFNNFVQCMLQGYLLNLARRNLTTGQWEQVSTGEEVKWPQDTVLLGIQGILHNNRGNKAGRGGKHMNCEKRSQYVIYEKISPSGEMLLLTYCPNVEWIEHVGCERFDSGLL